MGRVNLSGAGSWRKIRRSRPEHKVLKGMSRRDLSLSAMRELPLSLLLRSSESSSKIKGKSKKK